jgi:hypothetical protein
MVLGALATRQGLMRLAAESASSSDPDEFKARYEQFLVEVQAHL